MKKIIGYVFFILITSMANSQTYHPLIRTNVTWDEGGYLSPLPCYTWAGRSEFILGDSLIEGHYYRLENGYGMVGEPGPGGRICPPFWVDTVPYRGARLREDTLARRVFIWSEYYSNDHDQLLYDFSLQVGDTLQSEYTGMGATLIVTQIEDVTLLNGEVRKKFILNNDNECYYIEGIGGCFGLAEPIIPGLGFGSELFCVKENGIPLWGYKCNIPWVSTRETGNITFQVFPNPASDKVTFSFGALPPVKDARIILYDLFGKQVVQEISLQGKTEVTVDTKNLLTGIYFYTLTNGTNSRTGKIAVTH